MDMELKLILVLVLGLVLIWSAYYLVSLRKGTRSGDGSRVKINTGDHEKSGGGSHSEPRSICPYCETINRDRLQHCAACGARLDK